MSTCLRNGIYQQVNANGQIVFDNSPGENGGMGEEALLNHNETMASPSTSNTDVSSANCTPQHGGDEFSYGSAVAGKPRPSNGSSSARSNQYYTSNSLSRPAVGNVAVQQLASKVTTTFGPNNGLYSTVKHNGVDAIAPRAFNETTDSISRKNNHQSPLRKIEENNYETVMRPGVGNGLTTTRTMERRHIKNSEI